MGQTLLWDRYYHGTYINMGQTTLIWDKHSHQTDINMGQTTLT
jgi:hypothetical protein